MTLISVVFTSCVIGTILAIDSNCNGGACTPLTTTEKQSILDLHNELRDRVAGGGLVSEGHPAATDMNELVWDDGLENVAQEYAESCPGLAHNGNRSVEYLIQRNRGNTKFGPDSAYLANFCHSSTEDCIYIGENVIAGGSTYTITSLMSSMETGWFDEYNDWTFGNHSDGCATGKQCGHYTQMVWANTRYIGCGYSNGCSNGPVFVCNYFPGGNFNTVPPYTSGTSCSNCMSDRTICVSAESSESITANNYNSGNGYDALCGGGLCPTMCDGASFSRDTCDGTGCNATTIDCNDGTNGNNGGRDTCITDSPTLATSGPTPAPTAVTPSPTAPTTASPSASPTTATPTAPTSSTSCIELENSYTTLVGTYEEDGTVLNKAAYDRTDDARKIEWSTWPISGGAYNIKTSSGSTYGYCEQSVITDCGTNSWYFFAGQSGGQLVWSLHANSRIVSVSCPANVVINVKEELNSPLIAEEAESAGNSTAEMHIILCLLIVVLIVMCAMVVGFVCYINKKKSVNHVDEDKIEMLYAENNDNERSATHHGTPIGENINNNMHQQQLTIRVNDREIIKKVSQTTPVTPLMENEQFNM